MAPAVAASGFPVMAIQCLPCSVGFCVPPGRALNDWAATFKMREALKSVRIIFFIELRLSRKIQPLQARLKTGGVIETGVDSSLISLRNSLS